MKKTLIAIAVGALAMATTASANWYVQGDVGVSKTKFTSYSGMNKTKIEPRVAVGYRFGDVRVAADYTHHGKFSGNGNSAKVYGVGLSGIYDIDINSSVKPYVGARVATNVIDKSSDNSGALHDGKDTKLGYGAVAGVSYRVSQEVSINGGLEYNRIGSYDDTNINNYGAKVGARYEF